MGFHCATVSRNTLANANATRAWQIYAKLCQGLLGLHALVRYALRGRIFVIRAKSNTRFDRCYSLPLPSNSTSTHIVFDQIGTLALTLASKAYPQKVRCVKVKDEQGKHITFLTNNMDLPASTIAALH